MKKIIIIGSGIAGMSAGCYALMNNYDATIFEMHSMPGGLCTGWERKNYKIDGCIHWLIGSSKGSFFNKIFLELHALKNINIINHDEHIQIKLPGKKSIKINTDINELEKQLILISEKDKKAIKEITNAVRNFNKANLFIEKPKELFKIKDIFKLIWSSKSFLINYYKFKKITMEQYASKFKNQDLKKIFPMIFYFPGLSMFSFIVTMSYLHKKEAGYPEGGSLNFAKNIEKRFTGLGGRINYNSKVKKIIVENNKACGVELENGETIYSDIVISACDGYSTIFKMLGEKFISKKIYHDYENLDVFPGIIQVSIGINNKLINVPHNTYFYLDKPVFLAGAHHHWVNAQHYSFDKFFSDKGKTTIVLLLTTDYSFWKNLDPKKYKKEKDKIRGFTVEFIEEKFNEAKNRIEMIDIATPLTHERYTANFKGSIQGWFPAKNLIGYFFPKILPGLNNFYMTGQWVEPGGGVPIAALSGRNIIQIICNDDKKEFLSYEN